VRRLAHRHGPRRRRRRRHRRRRRARRSRCARVAKQPHGGVSEAQAVPRARRRKTKERRALQSVGG
jgi:hypothetical protein